MNKQNIKHLNPQEKPIQVCFDYVKTTIAKEIIYYLWFNWWVDYYSSTFRNKIMWNINPKWDSYVVSPVNSRNKISRMYYDCTWIAIVWKDKKWKNISLLTHQNPKYLFWWYNSYDKIIEFKNDLQSKIEELKQKTIPWSIDAMIVWGNYIKWEIEYNNEIFDMKENYRKSVEILRDIIFENFWFYPYVAWPMLDCWFSNILLDTKNRRINQARWQKENFMSLDITSFQSDKLEDFIPELDEKCKIKKLPIWEVFT